MTWRADARALCDECEAAPVGHGVRGWASSLRWELGRALRPGWTLAADNMITFTLNRLRGAIAGARGMANDLGAYDRVAVLENLDERFRLLADDWRGHQPGWPALETADTEAP